MSVTLSQARQIIDIALATGRQHDFTPLTVAVLDAGGHLVAFSREDLSGILRPDIAIGKAWGALGMGVSSRLLGERLGERPNFVSALSAASGGRFVPVPGGVLIRSTEGAIIGAVGISGDTSDRDELCAVRGVEAVGLVPDPAQASEGWEGSRL